MRLTGFIILFLVIIYIGPRNIINNLLRVNIIYFIPAIFFSVLSIVFLCLRWKLILLAMGQRDISFKTLFNITLLGLLSNMVAPGRLGDIPVRAYFLKKRCNIPYSDGLASTTTDRYIDIFSLFIFGFISVIIISKYIPFSQSSLHYIRAISGVALISMLILPAIIFSKYRTAIKLFGKISKKTRFERYYLKMEKYIPKIISNLYKTLNKNNIIYVGLMTLLMWTLFGISFYFYLLSFEQIYNFYAAFSGFFISYIVGLISMIPGGYGTSDIGVVFILTRVGYSNAAVLNASALLKIMNLIIMLILVIILSDKDDIYDIRSAGEILKTADI